MKYLKGCFKKERKKMKIIKDNKYLFLIQVGNKTLTFNAKVNSIDHNFVEFTDKFGKTLTYNLKNIISWEEIQ